MRIAQMHVRSTGFDARRCGTACAISAIFITSSLKRASRLAELLALRRSSILAVDTPTKTEAPAITHRGFVCITPLGGLGGLGNGAKPALNSV